MQYKEKRMEQEKELLQSQISWLNEELKAKSEELLSLSRQKGNQVLELRCKLENKEEEVCIYHHPQNVYVEEEKRLFSSNIKKVVVHCYRFVFWLCFYV